MDLEKLILRKVGEAIGRFRMIRDGDRVAVGLSGGKDSVTLLEALVLLQKRAPVSFSVCAFTVEQGKFLSPVQPFGEYLQARGIPTRVVNKLHEGRPHGVDLMVNGEVRLLINTPLGKHAQYDDYRLRQTAIAHRVSHTTTMSAAAAACDAILALKSRAPAVRAVQEWHEVMQMTHRAAE